MNALELFACEFTTINILIICNCIRSSIAIITGGVLFHILIVKLFDIFRG